VWLWRRIDFLFPWQGLSLIGVASVDRAQAEQPQHSLSEVTEEPHIA